MQIKFSNLFAIHVRLKQHFFCRPLLSCLQKATVKRFDDVYHLP